MSDIIIGIGEIAVSNKPGDIIKTYALGSCVAVIMYDKEHKKIAPLYTQTPYGDNRLTVM